MSLIVDVDEPAAANPEFAADLRRTLAEVEQILLAKNAAYGDSALNPVRIMSKASPTEGILIRIDDKLSRLARGEAAGEDVELDLLGYLVMLRIARKRAAHVTPKRVPTWRVLLHDGVEVPAQQDNDGKWWDRNGEEITDLVVKVLDACH